MLISWPLNSVLLPSQQLLKEVDKAGDEAMPSLSQVELTFPTEGQITFDEIRYKVEAQTSFWIQNVGKAVAHYRMYSGRAPDIRLREATQGHVFRNSLERAQLNYPT
jgi:secreted protein with Ig-like and vWFA domain